MQEKQAQRACFGLFHVRVVVDVFLAVTVVSVAAGAIAEFQFRITHICPSADSAPMGVGRFYGSNGSLVRTGRPELYGAGCAGGLFTEQPPGIGLPGSGNQIQNIPAKEQEIVGDSNQGKQVVRKCVDIGEDGKEC